MQAITIIAAASLGLSPLSFARAAEIETETVQDTASSTIHLGADGEIPDDATEWIQAAFDSAAKKVVIHHPGKPYVVGPLWIRSGEKEIVMQAGVELRAKTGAFKDRFISLLCIENAKQVTIRGNGATLRMNGMEYRQADHLPSEWRHALSIQGSEDILIEDLNVVESGGDGVYIGAAIFPTPPYPEGSRHFDKAGKGQIIPASRNVTIRRVVADRNYRQGLSLISGENILIEECLFRETRGTRPSAGLDIEPGMYYNVLKNVVVRNCVAEANDGSGFMVYIRKLKKDADPISITFEGCEVRGGKGQGYTVGAIGDQSADARIVFKDCKATDTEGPGIYVYDKSAFVGDLVFENCYLKNVATSLQQGTASPELASVANERRRPPQAPIVFYLRRQPDLTDVLGRITFINCHVEDGLNRPLIAQGAQKGEKDIRISDLHGNIATSHANPVLALGEDVSHMTLKVTSK